MSELKNKIVWITGASTGIGKSLAVLAAQKGAKVAITARSKDTLIAVVNQITAAGNTAFAFEGDVTSIAQMKDVSKQIEQKFGPIDILVSNAGTYAPTDPASFSSETYQDIMRLNYGGLLTCIEAVLPSMLLRSNGYIVGVASLVGYRGLPRACSYGASKAAVINFLESLRFDVEPYGISVSVVNPGFVKTPLTDKNDFEMPFLIDSDEAAKAIVKGLENKDFEIHFPKSLSYIFKLLRILPYSLYHTLISWKTKR